MSTIVPNIVVPVDLTNPGQFFACCGLLELANRLSEEASAWFDEAHFCLATEPERWRLADLLDAAKNLEFEVGDDVAGEEVEAVDKKSVTPIILRSSDGKVEIQLDWWNDRSLKPWAGSMNERIILRAMLSAIDPENENPFDDLRPVTYQSTVRTKAGKLPKPKKKEPFYFDARRGSKSHPLDSGFSPDVHEMLSDCCPALEALCFIGLQRARPAPTKKPNQSRYTVWPRVLNSSPGLPLQLMGTVVCGAVRIPGSRDYLFDNFFRTDQRKHKSFSVATPGRSV